MISRENGGAASLLDLAQGFSSLGADVSLIATSDSPTRFMVSRNRSGILKGYDRRGLHRIRLRRIDGFCVGGIARYRARFAEKQPMWLDCRGDLTRHSSQGLVRSDLIIDVTAGKAVGEFSYSTLAGLNLPKSQFSEMLYKCPRPVPEICLRLIAPW
jgi:hypothetical protein